MSTETLVQLEQRDNFIGRHIGPDESEENALLAAIGATNLEELSKQIVPADILREEFLDIADGRTEFEAINYLRSLANQNKVFKSYIGMGYHPTHLPAAIQRNIL